MSHCFAFASANNKFVSIGSRVRVKRGISEPSYGWGSVKPTSVGTVKKIEAGDAIVDFQEQKGWTCIVSHLEVIQGIYGYKTMPLIDIFQNML